jgi:hypothetical protein
MNGERVEDCYPTDELVEELTGSEWLLVGGLRLFAAQCREPGSVHRDWRDGFCAAGVAECCVPAFNALFKIVSAAAIRSLGVRYPDCRLVGGDEANLLRLTALLQRAETEAASAILASWLPHLAARMAMLPAQDLADAMAEPG